MTERLEMLLGTRIRVLSPSKRSLVTVISESQKTGDSRRLSSTDKEILALSLDLGYELVTDDYSLQNLASKLGVPFRSFNQKGIKEVVTWKAQCTGCGKIFSAEVEECDICGKATKMKRAKE